MKTVQDDDHENVEKKKTELGCGTKYHDAPEACTLLLGELADCLAYTRGESLSCIQV